MQLKRTAIALVTIVCIQAAQAYDPVMDQERERLLSLYHGSETAAISHGASARYISQTPPLEKQVDAKSNHAITDTIETSRLISYSEVSL